MNTNELITKQDLPLKAKILLVEDNKLNQVIFKHLLSMWGISPTVANNGAEALDILKHASKEPFHLVFMDCEMPVMDGYQTTQMIRSAHYPEIPADTFIVALTGNVSEQHKKKCLAVGMNAHIAKPIDTELFAHYFSLWLEQVVRQVNDKSTEKVTASSGQVIDKKNVTERKIQHPKPISAPMPADSDSWQYTSLMKRMRNNQQMVNKLITMFIEDIAIVEVELSQAVAQNDDVMVASLAHKAKGMSRNMGFMKLGKIFETLEHDAKIVKSDNYIKLFQQFIEEYGILSPMINNHLTD